MTLGVIEGRVAYEIKGEHGFGYDPYFLSSGVWLYYSRATDRKKKNEISHEGRGLQTMKKRIEER